MEDRVELLSEELCTEFSYLFSKAETDKIAAFIVNRLGYSREGDAVSKVLTEISDVTLTKMEVPQDDDHFGIQFGYLTAMNMILHKLLEIKARFRKK